MEGMTLRMKSKINVDGSSGSKSVDGVSRKPLSDLSNLNLISISDSVAQSLLWKYQAPVIQFQRHFKSSKSDSMSVTSIGSSNLKTSTKYNGRSSTCRHVPRSSASSIKHDENCEPALHMMNLEKHDKVNSPPVISKPVEKINDKGKSVSMPLRTTRSSHTKDKQKAVNMASDSTPFAKAIGEGNPIVSPASVKPLQKTNDKVDVVAVLPKADLAENSNDKFLGSCSYDKTKDKGKALAMPWISLFEQTEHRGKSIPITCPSIRRKRNSRDDDLSQADLTPSRTWTDPHPKNKKRRGTLKEPISENPLPEGFVKQQKAYFQEVDDFELEVEEAY